MDARSFMRRCRSTYIARYHWYVAGINLAYKVIDAFRMQGLAMGRAGNTTIISHAYTKRNP
ncbi:hypothetical protein C7120_09660 [Prevotella sp. oral taxon 376]|uniref:hypothetical protein n=1 Tax=Prevotella sp. oral taxon 376 TaxID=712466 RepID=UPI000D1EBB06|nr:hypothetical protein [Prevotella sp. oral taxon 376]PTL32576.1 hypothetical protein C7120_09660 [Prevotella sp. oral taxon 376]